MRRLKKIRLIFLLGIAFLALAGCKGNGLANEDILERSKSTNEIIWGVKYDTRLFGM
ncbi:glutamine ABC transporter substrate-binding protein, partial [Enterococcus faecium]|nr:glutamine ABC transporter substrate-binding protein [Enterococcus faecium]